MPALLGVAGGQLAVGDIIRLNMVAFVDSQQGMFGCSFKVTAIGGGGALPIGDLCVAWANLNGPRYVALTSERVRFIGVKGVFLAPVPAKASGIATDSLDGLNRNPELPQQASGFIRLESNGPGKRNRGRIYVPFPSQEFTNPANGEPTLLYVAALTNFAQSIASAQAVLAGLTSVSLEPVIASKTGTPNSTVVRASAIPLWATQRRRGNFGRINPGIIG